MKILSWSLFRLDSRLNCVSIISDSIDFRINPGINCNFSWHWPITILFSALVPWNWTFTSRVVELQNYDTVAKKKNFQPKNMPPFYWFRTQNLIPWRQNNLQGRLCGQQLFQVVQRIISTAQCKTKISSKVRMTSEFDWFCWKLLRFENKVQNNFTSLLSKTTAADNCNGWKIIPKLHNKKKDSDSNAPDLTLIDDVLPSLARFSLVYCLVPGEVPSKRLLSHLWFRPYSILPKSRQLAHHSCPLSSQSIHLSAWRLPPVVKLTGTQRRSPFF